MVLFNGQILSTEKDDFSSNVIKFEQLNIDLKNLQTDTIKVPKLQETGTYDLLDVLQNLHQRKLLIAKKLLSMKLKPFSTGELCFLFIFQLLHL